MENSTANKDSNHTDYQRHEKAFGRILQIMDDLRSKCPWDKKQTMDSLRYLTIEEVYELSDALIKQDMVEIKKELGDILLHVVFYSKIASESQTFDIADVIHSLCEKLIVRHPHVYGNVIADDEEAVKRNWEEIKLKEKASKKGTLDGVPKSMPALVKAIRIQEKARGIGFDWENASQVWDKVQEELAEFSEEVAKENKEKAEKEFGDVMFALINYARFQGINPEDALEKTNQKFIHRFAYMEEQAEKDGKQLNGMTLEQMESYWNASKKIYT